MDAGLEQRIRDAYAAFAAGDADAAVAGMHKDVTMINPPDAIETGTHRGRGYLREAFQRLLDEFDYESLDIIELAEGPRGVVVQSRWVGRGRGSGAPIDANLTHVFEIREGRVATYRWFHTLAEGREAAGL